jgi:hypothetical protein
LLQRMSLFMARLRHADGRSACLLIGEDRKSPASGQNDAFDPTRTSGVIIF